MKSVCVLVLLALVALAAAVVDMDAPAINREMIDAINANPDSTWVAGENPRLKDLTIKDFSKLLGLKSMSHSFPVHTPSKVAAIPDSFDSRDEWKGCIGPILDQGHCGSCWAFGAVESLQDRLCIETKGKFNATTPLSEQYVVSCDSTNDGCNGGELMAAWQFLAKKGTTSEECYPYAMGTCHHPGCSDLPTPKCNKTCHDGKPYGTMYYAKSAYAISSKVEDIQTEIMTNGPVEVAYAVYEDFATYTSGVYIHTNGSLLGFHAVKNIGWGVDAKNVPYWIIQNSWNTDWGMNGIFWIRRGTNECGIEGNVVAGMGKAMAV